MFYKQKKAISVLLILTLLIASIVLSLAKPTNVQASAGWECQYRLPSFPLNDVWGSSSSDVFAVGAGTILQYDGNTWDEMESGTTEWLWDVWGTSSDVFAVGALDNGIILHYPEVVEMVYEIDKKPGSDSNPVYTKAKGFIPVAILDSSELDVESSDYANLELYHGPELGVGGAEPKHNINSKKVFMSYITDVNDDLIPDLVVHFRVQDFRFCKGV